MSRITVSVFDRLSFRSLPFFAKFSLAPAVAGILLIVVAFLGQRGLSQQSNDIDAIVEGNLEGTLLLVEAFSDLQANNEALYDLALMQAAGVQLEDFDSRVAELAPGLDEVLFKLGEYRDAHATAQDAPRMQSVIEEIETYGETFELVASMLRVDAGVAAAFLVRFQDNFRRVSSLLKDVVDTARLDSRQRARAATSRAQRASLYYLGSILLAFAGIAGITLLITRESVRPIHEIARATLRLAEGDRSVDLPRLERGDELGAIVRSLEVFRSNLERMERLQRERREAEERANREIQHSEQKFRNLFEHANDAILIVDPSNRRILGANRNASRMLGYSRAELTALHEDALFKAGTGETLTARLGPGARRRTDVYEARLKRRDDSEFTVEISARLIDYGGQPAIQALVRDVTSRKRQEIALREAMREAKMASRSKSEFLANMSHELRTPLNAIIGFSETMTHQMLGPVGNPKYLEYANDIRFSGQHLLQIINDILDLAKIEAGQIRPNIEALRIDEIVDQCAAMVRSRAREKSIELIVAADPDLPTIHSDPLRIKQVLLNLLSNAVKFTDRGGTVALKAEADDQGFVIEISDTGIGMTEKEIETALQPFGQVESSFTRSHEGTGLGLPLVLEFARLLCGRVDISSVKGEGTSITIRLPFDLDPNSQSEQSCPIPAVGGNAARR